MIEYESSIEWKPFSYKHKRYIRRAMKCKMSVGEGAVRCGKTIDNCIIASAYLEICPDKIHLATGSSLPNAKLNIGDCNGFGLEYQFKGRCHWGKYKDNEALFIDTKTGEKVVIFAGGGKADSYKKILGNSYGLWIATEINEHYDCDDSKTSFIKVAMARQVASRWVMILWDLNPSNPRARIYTDYIDKYRDEGLLGGYNYEHFTIKDNLAISEKRRQEIISQYGDVNSAWYRRDILGERCTCEGLCYQYIADHYNEMIIDKPQGEPMLIHLGIDFGGRLSQHSFTCTFIGRRYMWACVVKAKQINADGLSPNDLDNLFEQFVLDVRKEFDIPTRAIDGYYDSAEQTLMNGLDERSLHSNLGVIKHNAYKSPIQDRIKGVLKLAYKGRLKWLKGAESSLQAISSCVYDSRDGHEDERLDNGSTNIDGCDSTEYTIEPVLDDMLRMIDR